MKSSAHSFQFVSLLAFASATISAAYATTTLNSSGTWTVTSPANNGELVTTGPAIIDGVHLGRGLGGLAGNVGLGINTIVSVTTGNYLTAVGPGALRYNTSGESNVAIGYTTLNVNSTASHNTGVGFSSLKANQTGSFNTAIGSKTLYNNTSGEDNVAIGTDAGSTWANGTTALTDAENSIYIGSGARGKDNGDSNSIVIGTDAIGEGANTTVIGNSSTVKTHIYGAIIMDSPQGDISMGIYN